MQNKKTEFIKIRMTTEELRQWKEKAAPFGSMSHYIRSAVAEFSNVSIKEKWDLMLRLNDYYKEWTPHIGHLGANFNQTVKQVNELAKVGLLKEAQVKSLITIVQDVKGILVDLKKDLHAVTAKSAKF